MPCQSAPHLLTKPGLSASSPAKEARMIFSALARLLAIAAIVVGLLSVLSATSAMMGFMDEAAQARYVGRSPGKAIDWGIYTILVGVALGTLAEISFTVRKL